MQRKRLGRRVSGGDVYGITTARRSQHDDVHSRMVKYGVSMGIRLVCFVLAFVVHGWLAWIFIAGAVLLPYVAVLLANAGRETAPATPATLIGSGAGAAPPSRPAPPQRAIGAAPAGHRRSGQVPPGSRASGGAPRQGQWQHSYPPPGSPRRALPSEVAPPPRAEVPGRRAS